MNPRTSLQARTLALILCLGVAQIAAAQPSPTPVPAASPTPAALMRGPKLPPQLPKLLQEIEARYTEAGTLRAEYTQITETRALGQKKTTSGILEVKRPDKLRWEQQKPDANLLVSDGKTFWFYTPPFEEGERGQVIEKKTSEVQSRLATSLLAGSFSKSARDMRIQARTESIFMLQPRRGAAGSVSSIELETDPKTKTIQRVRLLHRDGNLSEITLKNIQLGDSAPDSRFEFTPPPNTDRVRE